MHYPTFLMRLKTIRLGLLSSSFPALAAVREKTEDDDDDDDEAATTFANGRHLSMWMTRVAAFLTAST